MKIVHTWHRKQAGTSYIEVLIAMFIISISIVPVVSALRTSLQSSETDGLSTVRQYYLMSKMESVLARPHAELLAQAGGAAVATSFSDDAGSEDRRLVYISGYDGDNADADNNAFTGTDTGLLWIQVAIENSVDQVQALKSNQ